MANPSSKQIFIQGITKDGKTFRPSDWAERLAGVMSQFRPGGSVPGSHLSYSEWCLPTSMKAEVKGKIEDIKCVVVHTDLRDEHPMAWDFVMNFAKDNDLLVVEACLLT
jgi:ABC-type proline/glycine betaine transport system substrate-binding protein